MVKYHNEAERNQQMQKTLNQRYTNRSYRSGHNYTLQMSALAHTESAAQVHAKTILFL